MTATCMTDGCSKFGEPIDVDTTQTDLETGAPITVTSVVCGGCGQQITDTQGA